jgi:hypothetical protein
MALPPMADLDRLREEPELEQRHAGLGGRHQHLFLREPSAVESFSADRHRHTLKAVHGYSCD